MANILGPSSIRSYQIQGGILVTCTNIFLIIVFLLLYFEVINPRFGYSIEDVDNLPLKLQFTLKFLILPVSWLALNVLLVILTRIRTEAIDPLTNNEHLTLKLNKILTNSCEQALILIISQLILVDYLTPTMVLQFIPSINILFIVGRFLFLFGYPRYRGVGFLMSYAVSFLMIVVIWVNIIASSSKNSSKQEVSSEQHS